MMKLEESGKDNSLFINNKLPIVLSKLLIASAAADTLIFADQGSVLLTI